MIVKIKNDYVNTKWIYLISQVCGLPPVKSNILDLQGKEVPQPTHVFNIRFMGDPDVMRVTFMNAEDAYSTLLKLVEVINADEKKAN